jgi:hypothetical protein
MTEHEDAERAARAFDIILRIEASTADTLRIDKFSEQLPSPNDDVSYFIASI